MDYRRRIVSVIGTLPCTGRKRLRNDYGDGGRLMDLVARLYARARDNGFSVLWILSSAYVRSRYLCKLFRAFHSRRHGKF